MYRMSFSGHYRRFRVRESRSGMNLNILKFIRIHLLARYFSTWLIIRSGTVTILPPFPCPPGRKKKVLSLYSVITAREYPKKKKREFFQGDMIKIPGLVCSWYMRSFRLPVSPLKRQGFMERGLSLKFLFPLTTAGSGTSPTEKTPLNHKEIFFQTCLPGPGDVLHEPVRHSLRISSLIRNYRRYTRIIYY